MKNFVLTPKMLSLGGVFYPTGYAVIMFPDAEDARQVAAAFEGRSKDIMLLTPDDIMSQIGQMENHHADLALPGVGTESATVRKYIDLARDGDHALMVAVDSDESAEALMKLVRERPFSYAQRYHLLAIEDLE